MRQTRSAYLFGPKRTKRIAKLDRLRAKGWLNQPDQHVIDYLAHQVHKPLPGPAQPPERGSSSPQHVKDWHAKQVLHVVAH